MIFRSWKSWPRRPCNRAGRTEALFFPGIPAAGARYAARAGGHAPLHDAPPAAPPPDAAHRARCGLGPAQAVVQRNGRRLAPPPKCTAGIQPLSVAHRERSGFGGRRLQEPRLI